MQKVGSVSVYKNRYMCVCVCAHAVPQTIGRLGGSLSYTIINGVEKWHSIVCA